MSDGIWRFVLALVFLYLLMAYIPHGREVGLLILIGVLLSTAAVPDAFCKLMTFVQTGKAECNR